MIAQSRSHLASFMDGHMNRVQGGVRNASGHPGDAVPIKTYLIEGSGPIPDPDDLVGPFGTLGRMTQDNILGARLALKLHPSADPDLSTITGTPAGGAPVFAYVDYADPRFWLVHTFAPSRLADRFMAMLVTAHRDVGRAALSSEFLEATARMGATVALSLDHECRIVEQDTPGVGTPEFVRARVWGTEAKRVLGLRQQLGAFSDGIALSQIRLRYTPEGAGEGRFCLDDVRFDGRMITRGTSFAAHRALAEALRASYAGQIERIESRHRVRLQDRDGVLLGRSMALYLTTPVRDLHGLCEAVFSSANPFLLWGLPVKRAENSVYVQAVDLNLGHRLDFEFTPDLIRVFIPKETSGGTVARFYTNLQRHLDPRVRLVDQDENEVLQP